mmetsp:Transcript_19940/g.61454  ORF Transcript_19940/g.61454 Transcript_19940/m.61454 type:complete len:200 (+) Transcript_19940:1429-2028(+)
MGTVAPVSGWTANDAVATPVFVLASAVRSMSDLRAAASAYVLTSSALPSSSASGCSGARTTYVAPISVSGRVVKTSILSDRPSTSKATVAPSDRPIHSRCDLRVPAGQSRPSSPARSLSAYSVIRRIHWRSGALTTGWSPRSDNPSMTSSFASTVPSAGHQLTGTSFCAARPASNNSRKIHCVHLTYSGSVVDSSRSQS